jgi:hypothetical protein
VKTLQAPSAKADGRSSGWLAGNERRAKQMEFWKRYNGQQSGDPAKLAQALITISGQEKPPRRFIAGADAVDTAEQVAATLRQQTDAYRKLSSSLAYDDAA